MMLKEARMLKQVGLLVVLSGAAIASGCTSLGIRPWQRDVMARADMQLGGNPLDAAIDDHMYFSKEASSGGRSFAGGGCGCN
jgi:Domain of unknown function (DUF4266)